MRRSSGNRGCLRIAWPALVSVLGFASLGWAAQPLKSPDFQTDIEEILTKRGCNDSHCHGGVKGRGGLKLSHNALVPHEDFDWIVKGGTYQVLSAEPKPPVSPRIDLKQPEKSLLLLKPTSTVPHAGGERFKVGSADYMTILNWVRNGAPYGNERTAKIERLDVSPTYVFLPLNGKQQLQIKGHLSDGREEDLTHRVLYESNNSDVAKVTPDGLVSASGAGETVV